MMYPYITLPDNTEITHSHLIEENGVQMVEVHFERPQKGGFDTARCVLPLYQWKNNEGFSKEEMSFFDKLLRHNVHLFYRYAKQGGIGCGQPDQNT